MCDPATAEVPHEVFLTPRALKPFRANVPSINVATTTWAFHRNCSFYRKTGHGISYFGVHPKADTYRIVTLLNRELPGFPLTLHLQPGSSPPGNLEGQTKSWRSG